MKKPDMMPHEFSNAWNKKNAGDLAALFSDDASFINVVGLWWNSRDEIFRAHDYGLKIIFPKSALKVLKVRTNQITDDIAVVNARFLLTGQSENKGVSAPGKRRTVFTFVMHCKNDTWTCVAAHNTDIVPGYETNILDKEGKLSAADYRDNL